MSLLHQKSYSQGYRHATFHNTYKSTFQTYIAVKETWKMERLCLACELRDLTMAYVACGVNNGAFDFALLSMKKAYRYPNGHYNTQQEICKNEDDPKPLLGHGFFLEHSILRFFGVVINGRL